MTFEKVDGIPKSTHCIDVCDKKSLRLYFDKFMDMNVKYVAVKFDIYDYVNANSAYVCFRNAVKRHIYPIKVYKRNDQIYLERTDISFKAKCSRSRKKVD